MEWRKEKPRITRMSTDLKTEGDIPACHAVDPWRRRACHGGRRVPNFLLERSSILLPSCHAVDLQGKGGRHQAKRCLNKILCILLIHVFTSESWRESYPRNNRRKSLSPYSPPCSEKLGFEALEMRKRLLAPMRSEVLHSRL